MSAASLKNMIRCLTLRALFFAALALAAAALSAAPLHAGDSAEVCINAIYFMPVGSMSNPFTQMAEVGLQISDSLYPQIRTSRIYLYFDGRINDYIKSILSVGDHSHVIGIGSYYAAIFDELADAYPDKKFIVIDARAENKKVKSIDFDNFEAGYMAGAACAQITASAKIGFIGGSKDKVILDFEKGFRTAAAKNQTGPKALEINSEYISEGVEGYSDPAAGGRIASAMYDKGCDVLFAAAGASGLGAIEAARKRKKYIVGVDSDQDSIAPGNVVTSVIKRLDNAIINLNKDIAENKLTAERVTYGFGNAGLTFSAFKHTKNKIGKKKYDKIINSMFSR